MTKPKQMACEHCNTVLIAKQQSKSFTFGGLFGAFAFILGVFIMIGGYILPGIVCIAFGLVLSIGLRKQETILICPTCEKTIKKL